ncbi:Stress-induced-phosphoprotein 1 [Fragariocoptes setiger]|uniref:Stress-induced-phosphoprotein 1 n=1 Tax=Fragariocoptes setiger TaxID=1670756 RepID=A0ABQ7SA93_9ACAR|nr:Stress-induced-phosphoprotein 1 [Fragariocoptes setiger]
MTCDRTSSNKVRKKSILNNLHHRRHSKTGAHRNIKDDLVKVVKMSYNYFGKILSFYNEINSATLTGAIDIIVVKQQDGTYFCSPFHVRFGKLGVLRSKEKLVDIEVNGQPVDLSMKLGENGEAFFQDDDSDKLSSLNLQPGPNEAVFSVTTAYQGTARCKCCIYLWNHDDKIIVSDIDGTITKSDVLGQLLPFVGKDWAQSGVATLFTKIYDNGYKFLYLSARAIGQSNLTREYLRSVKQDDVRLPDGPLLLSPTSLLSAFHREVIEKKPEIFKIECLNDIKKLFPSNPFYAAFGNKINDVWAYRSVQIPPKRIFTINHHGVLRLELHHTFQSSYTYLSDVVDQMFPPALSGSFINSDYSDINYWRNPLPELDSDEIASISNKNRSAKGDKRVGIGAIHKEKQRQELFQQRGSDLAKEELERLSSQMIEFRDNLQEFARKYKKDIKRTGGFRRHFQQMCAVAGVDPLRSSANFWTKMLGVGDFYYELAIQIVEVFMSSSHRNGGIMPMDELISRVLSSRNATNENLAKSDSVNAEDVINAIDKLSVLGGNIKILPSKGTYIIHAVPAELNSDHLLLTQLAHSNGGYITKPLMSINSDWPEQRISKAIDELIMEGLVWIDTQTADHEPSYWFPGLNYRQVKHQCFEGNSNFTSNLSDDVPLELTSQSKQFSSSMNDYGGRSHITEKHRSLNESFQTNTLLPENVDVFNKLRYNSKFDCSHDSMYSNKSFVEVINDFKNKTRSSRRFIRVRTKFSEAQILALEMLFDNHKYLNSLDRELLSRQLSLSSLQVKTWFQNRRMKWKKQDMWLLKLRASSLFSVTNVGFIPENSKADQCRMSAVEEKNLGNEAYKAKNFEKALEHYNKAIELNGTDMTFINNKAAVYFEMGDLDECIKQCQSAIEVGRENRADFKLIAKAFSRMASAYQKKGDLENARTFYQKSLSEHRTPETVSKLNEVEKIIKEREMKAYIDPEKSLEEKNKGNELFQKGDYPSAVRHYTEAIRRNPEDAKLYSNRAACYQKLAEFKLACDDAEACIKLDPKFVKGHIRRGLALIGMKKNTEAAEAFRDALEIDENNQEALDGYRRAVGSADPEETRKRAMNNPEIQEIINDPAMRMILTQAQSDPKALGEHLQNPDVKKKFQKLLEAGIVTLR